MRRWSLLLPLLLAGGCSLMPPVTGPTRSIEELAQAHRYNSALEALKRTARDQPDYRERRRELLDAAREWRRQLFAELDELMASQQFAAAELRLETAMAELPETPALHRYAARLYAERDAFVEEQMAALTRLRGEHLLEEQPYYERLRGIEGDYRLRDTTERYREDAEYFAGQLREAGMRAFEAGDWNDATELLSLSNRLHPNAFTATHLSAAETQLRTVQDIEQIELRQRTSVQRTALRRQFESAMRGGDLDAAAAVLKEVARLPDESLARKLQRQLTRAQQAAAATDIEAGNRLYGDGKVEQALRHWQRAQRYDDSAELQAKVERAQRLLEHYETLREQSR